MIANRARIGPDADKDLKEGITRTEVEREFGEPLITEALPDGNVRAVYRFTARVGRSKELVQDPGVFWWDAMTFGLSEFVFMPWAYYAKEERTYQIEVVYSPSGTLVAWYSMEYQWEDCAIEADRALPGTHAMEEWRTYLGRCIRKDDPVEGKRGVGTN